MEAGVVRFADRLGYVNHDIDDAIRAGLITEADLPVEVTEVLGHTHGRRIETLVTDIVETTGDGPEVRMSDPVFAALDRLRDFMFERVYLREESAREQDKAIGVIRALFSHYLEHPEEVPEEYAGAPGTDADRVADYIAGMTDRFALTTYERLFLPQGWML
jgi:dGTPase